MSNARIKPVLFTGKKYSDGTYPILIRITSHRKSNYIKTGYSVLPENWNEVEQKVYDKKPRITPQLKQQLTPEALKETLKQFQKAIVLPNAARINADIQDKITDLLNLKRKLEVNEQNISSDILKRQLDKKYKGDLSSDIFNYGNSFIQQLSEKGLAGTYRRYKTILGKLKVFHPSALRFEEIDHAFLSNYESYLIREGYKTNYIHNHLKTIKALYRQAIQDGVASQQQNPFFTYKLKLDYNTRKEKLSEQELVSLKNLKLERGSKLWHVRNYFLFSFYMAGIRVSDLMQLRWTDVKDGRVEYNMDKTGGFKSIKIHKELEQILQHYKTKNSKPSDFIFPMLDSSKDYSNPFYLKNQISSKTTLYNASLKKLAELAEINKKLTTHIARHTFADLARKKGAKIYDVSKALGHSSIRITENYLSKFDQDSVDSTLDNVFSSL